MGDVLLVRFRHTCQEVSFTLTSYWVYESGGTGTETNDSEEKRHKSIELMNTSIKKNQQKDSLRLVTGCLMNS